MDSKVLEAIFALVAYLEHDEAEDFECKREGGEDVSNHIHTRVQTVADWLDTQPEISFIAERYWRRALQHEHPRVLEFFMHHLQF